MSNIEMNRMHEVLSQMKVAAAHIDMNANEHVNKSTQSPSFSSLFVNAVNQVNDFQVESGKLANAFSLGDPNVKISDVMIASEKSGVAFQAMVEVRNKIVNAYQEIMNMPV